MKLFDRRWPAQEARDDFADRVVGAALRGSRANLAGTVEAAPHRARNRFLGRAAMAWAASATLVAVLLVAYLGKTKMEHEREARLTAAKLVAAEQQALRLTREREELEARIAILSRLVAARDEQDRLRSDPKLQLPQKQMSTRPSGSMAPAGSARPDCNCDPGDALCSCL
jgi:colicin import membrane protein